MICKEVYGLMQHYGERDPWKLAKAMNIIVDQQPMGNSPNACKGFYLYQSRKRHITINSDLPETAKRIILAHELGHAVLHQKTKINNFHEFVLYDSTSQYEYEANLFAAEYLLDDELVR